jgi:signal transduction histidine kinase
MAWIAAASAAAAALAALVYRARVRAARTSSLYRGFFRSAPGPAFILDREGRVTEWNGVAPPWAGMDGARPEDILGRPFHLLPPFYSEEARIAVRAALRGDESRPIERRFAPEGGAEVSLRLRCFGLRSAGGAIRAAAVVVEDGTRDTEGVRLRDRESRLASLRRFAGRVAEDSRSALRAAQEMGSRPADPFLLERLRRAEGLLAKLEAFAGTGQPLAPSPQPLPLNDVLERLSGRISGGAIKVDFRGQTGLWSVSASAEALESALGEILRNAVEAMPEKGVLALRAANLRVDDGLGALEPGSYVEIQIRDTGPGIEGARLERIFEPFQSTKPRESAFGLGLALAHSLVRKMGGDIRIESRVGEGTTVRVYVPAARA